MSLNFDKIYVESISYTSNRDFTDRKMIPTYRFIWQYTSIWDKITLSFRDEDI